MVLAKLVSSLYLDSVTEHCIKAIASRDCLDMCYGLRLVERIGKMSMVGGFLGQELHTGDYRHA